jgi:hypothetical protein
MSLKIAIAPNRRGTRILALSQEAKTVLLQARLASDPKHPEAVSKLLEALALWQGEKVRAVLVVDAREPIFATSRWSDCSGIAKPTSLYRLSIAGHLTPPVHRRLRGLGPFRDLYTLLEEVQP